MPGHGISSWSLPSSALLDEQADWLAPARSRLLRLAHIARCKHVLDLGAGYGAVTGELVRRSGGAVYALEPQLHALTAPGVEPFAGAVRTCATASALPFASHSFDLIFSQLTLLWVQPLQDALGEIKRVLMPGGALVAIEPDYAGMIEYPPAIACRELWMTGLTRAGADPYVGRKLPALLAALGFHVRVSLFDTLFAPHAARFDFLYDLPLSSEEKVKLEDIQWTASALSQPWSQVAHLPHMLIHAVNP